jgi:YHS domain-containing protein
LQRRGGEIRANRAALAFKPNVGQATVIEEHRGFACRVRRDSVSWLAVLGHHDRHLPRSTMPSVDQLLSRIDAAFKASDDKLQAFQTQKVEELHGRQQRLEQFEKLLEQLQGVWKPRLETLAKRFGEKIKVSPTVTPERRSALFAVQSELARIELRLSVFTDVDVRKAVFDYDLEILPILMKFDSHSQIEFPLDAVDQDKLAQWIDDRIVSFVNTYLSLHENVYYLKGHMVEDPVAKMQFPKYAAGATAEVGGKTVYFISEETRREFLAKKSGS